MLTHVSIIRHVLDPISVPCLSVFFMFIAQPSLKEVKIPYETSLPRHTFSCSLEVVGGLFLSFASMTGPVI